jgi:hypothetical protein
MRAATACFPAGRLAIAVATVVACAGCYDPSLHDCRVHCSSPADCPHPFVCVPGGFCAAPGHICPSTYDAGDGLRDEASQGDAVDGSDTRDASDARDANDARDAMSSDGPRDLANPPDHPRDHVADRVPMNQTCDHSKPFDQPIVVHVSGDSGGGDNPWLTRDELSMYIDTGLDPIGRTIYVFTRPSVSAAFSFPEMLPNLGTANTRPSVTADELTICFEGSPSGFRGPLIMCSTRSSVNDDWPAPTFLFGTPPVYGSAADGGPFVMPRGDVIYFHRETENSSWDIWRTELLPTGWSAPAAVGGVNSQYDERNPVLSEDELTMFFGSTRLNPPRSNPDVDGVFSIWVATRQSRLDDFDPPALVQELPADNVFPGWLSPDGCRLYFRHYDGGPFLFYMASRPLAADSDAGVSDAALDASD